MFAGMLMGYAVTNCERIKSTSIHSVDRTKQFDQTLMSFQSDKQFYTIRNPTATTHKTMTLVVVYYQL